jgi:hypothetical protein
MKQSNEQQSSTEPLNIYSSIKELPLKTFIHCSCYEDYTVLCKTDKAQFSEEEKGVLSAAWMRLLSEYYAVTEDENASNFLQIVREMESIRFRAEYVAFLLTALSYGFVEEIALRIRTEFMQLKFNEQSYERDMELCLNIERKNTLRYNQLKQEFTRLQQEKESDNKTGDQKYAAFTQLLIDLNAKYGNQFSRETPTFDFAVAVNMMQKEYEQALRDKQQQ